jgi:probable phosphoglycerate mutase
MDQSAPGKLGYASFPTKPGSITTLIEDDHFHNRQVVTRADIRHLT